MHVQTRRMRVLSYPDSLYQDDGTVLKNIITTSRLLDRVLTFNQSIN